MSKREEIIGEGRGGEERKRGGLGALVIIYLRDSVIGKGIPLSRQPESCRLFTMFIGL